MSAANVVSFLQTLSLRADLLKDLRTRTKEQVLHKAASLGHPFTEGEFNSVVWELERRLAEERTEPFDAAFPLWRCMWGAYYLEYLIVDLLSSCEEAGLLEPAADSHPISH